MHARIGKQSLALKGVASYMTKSTRFFLKIVINKNKYHIKPLRMPSHIEVFSTDLIQNDTCYTSVSTTAANMRY